MSQTDWHWETSVVILLREIASGADAKRLQQFVCACCRRIEHLIRDDRSRRGPTCSVTECTVVEAEFDVWKFCRNPSS